MSVMKYIMKIIFLSKNNLRRKMHIDPSSIENTNGRGWNKLPKNKNEC